MLSYLTLSYHHITYAILSSRLLLYLCYLMNRIVQQSGGKKYYVSVFITWGWQEGEHKRRSCALRIVLPPKKNISLYEKITSEEHNYHTKQIFHSASSYKYLFPAYISYISDKNILVSISIYHIISKLSMINNRLHSVFTLLSPLHHGYYRSRNFKSRLLKKYFNVCLSRSHPNVLQTKCYKYQRISFLLRYTALHNPPSLLKAPREKKALIHSPPSVMSTWTYQ